MQKYAKDKKYRRMQCEILIQYIVKIFTSNVLQKTKDSVYLFYYLLINLSNNQTNEKDLTYKVRVSYRMYPYLFHTTSREAKNLFQEQDNRITGLIVSRITNTLIHTKHLYSTQST